MLLLYFNLSPFCWGIGRFDTRGCCIFVEKMSGTTIRQNNFPSQQRSTTGKIIERKNTQEVIHWEVRDQGKLPHYGRSRGTNQDALVETTKATENRNSGSWESSKWWGHIIQEHHKESIEITSSQGSWSESGGIMWHRK